MKLKFILPIIAILLFSCSSENEKADDSILGIWKITKAFQGNQSTTNEAALTGCENNWRYAFGTDNFYNEASLSAEIPCDLVSENAYKWAETGTNTYECRRISDNELYFSATIENGTMTLYRPGINRTYQLKHATN
ncbi:hypothetical protein [Flavobacterium pallidum]|uniref:Lipocalin-like domain-containing protein n=1 Tax=Flavobacterium pallidum TaxID=2172098 RepID=A0A2S1SHD0_9FLAO|nr:hypothetical protein [Flavobacterium pallidum]AWI25757.1 hypothetical protein HYN49_07500 [Flavobacterium pallidum]